MAFKAFARRCPAERNDDSGQGCSAQAPNISRLSRQDVLAVSHPLASLDASLAGGAKILRNNDMLALLVLKVARMHIVYAIDSLIAGGAQRQAVELALYLKSYYAQEVSILFYNNIDFYAPRLQEHGIPAVLIPKYCKADPLVILRIRQWLLTNKPDIVHAFLPLPALWYFLGSSLLPGFLRPIFIAAERRMPGDGSLLQDAARRLTYQRAQAVTANAQNAAREISIRYHVPPEQVHYLPNGINLDDWSQESLLRSPMERAPGCFHIALIGALRPEKNHLAVLDALDRLAPEFRRQCRVWFVGGEAGDPVYVKRVGQEIQRRSLTQTVRMIPPLRHVAPLMRQLDALVLPSTFEGFPNVVLEAMASGVPVIATPVGEIPHMIEDGVTGFLLERADAQSLSFALGRLRGLPESERGAIGQRARASVARRYAMPIVVARHLELYRSLVSRATKCKR